MLLKCVWPLFGCCVAAAASSKYTIAESYAFSIISLLEHLPTSRDCFVELDILAGLKEHLVTSSAENALQISEELMNVDFAQGTFLSIVRQITCDYLFRDTFLVALGGITNECFMVEEDSLNVLLKDLRHRKMLARKEENENTSDIEILEKYIRLLLKTLDSENFQFCAMDTYDQMTLVKYFAPQVRNLKHESLFHWMCISLFEVFPVSKIMPLVNLLDWDSFTENEVEAMLENLMVISVESSYYFNYIAKILVELASRNNSFVNPRIWKHVSKHLNNESDDENIISDDLEETEKEEVKMDIEPDEYLSAIDAFKGVESLLPVFLENTDLESINLNSNDEITLKSAVQMIESLMKASKIENFPDFAARATIISTYLINKCQSIESAFIEIWNMGEVVSIMKLVMSSAYYDKVSELISSPLFWVNNQLPVRPLMFIEAYYYVPIDRFSNYAYTGLQTLALYLRGNPPMIPMCDIRAPFRPTNIYHVPVNLSASNISPFYLVRALLRWIANVPLYMSKELISHFITHDAGDNNDLLVDLGYFANVALDKYCQVSGQGRANVEFQLYTAFTSYH